MTPVIHWCVKTLPIVNNPYSLLTRVFPELETLSKATHPCRYQLRVIFVFYTSRCQRVGTRSAGSALWKDHAAAILLGKSMFTLLIIPAMLLTSF